jgi:hypothetical protein
MDELATTRDDTDALRRSAHELQRGAGDLVKHAGGAWSMPDLLVALAHVEEALDRLSVGMLLMARGVADSRGQDSDVTLTPEAEALCFHLRRAADKLHAPQAATQAARMWARRELGAHAAPAASAGARSADERARTWKRSARNGASSSSEPSPAITRATSSAVTGAS